MSVTDSGMGIEPLELGNIFKPFYQLGDAKYHHSSKFAFKGGGAGLGLSYCRSIIEAHLGEIWAESAGPGRGSSFYVKLPVSVQGAMQPAATPNTLRMSA